MTVTPNDMAICSSLQVTVTCENFQNIFFTLNDVKLPKMAKFSKKIFSKILRCDVTSSDVIPNDLGHLLVTSQVTVTSSK